MNAAWCGGGDSIRMTMHHAVEPRTACAAYCPGGWPIGAWSGP
jgi:hypothetical protein